MTRSKSFLLSLTALIAASFSPGRALACKDIAAGPAFVSPAKNQSLREATVALTDCEGRVELSVNRPRAAQAIDRVSVSPAGKDQAWSLDNGSCRLGDIEESATWNKAILVDRSVTRLKTSPAVAEVWVLDKSARWIKQNPSTLKCARL